MTEQARLRILVIDDDSFQCSIVSKLLGTMADCDVSTQTDARLAVPLIDSGWDLLLLDLNMPDMDGIEFLSEMAAASVKPPVVFFSGEEDRILEVAEELAKSLAIEVLGSIAKPVSKEKLSAVLDQVNRGQEAPKASAYAFEQLSVEEIRTGIDRGAVEMVYQPKVEANSLQLVGVESLLRWRKPDGSLIGPGAVIPTAEANDLIYPLTRAVLRQSIAQQGEWRARDFHIKVSINLSVDDLVQPDLVAFLDQLLNEHRVPADTIVLEVTESKLVDDVNTVLAALTRLRLKGFGLSIDDFGTGFSSMEQLRRFPFSELKIDRAFVNGAHRRASAKAIFQSSVNLANALNMVSVAEGVEDDADLDLAVELGTHLIQGYHIAKPMSAIDLERWFEGRGH